MDILNMLNSLGGAGREVAKALTGTLGAGSDLANLNGAGALRVENLDPVLMSVTVQKKHFDLFNRLLPHKRNTFSMLDQQIIKKGIGGFPGSAISTETATGRPDRQGDYERLLTELGVFVDYRAVGLVTAMQGLMQQQASKLNTNAVAEENVNAALTILESIEWSLFKGNRSVNGMEINGIARKLVAEAGDHVTDLRGASITDESQIVNLANRAAMRPHFGHVDLAYCSSQVKIDLDNSIRSGYRVNLDSGVPNTEIGVPIKAIRYSAVGIAQGNVEVIPHAYVDEQDIPVEALNAEACGPQAGASTLTSAVAVDGSSKFLAAHAGAFFYGVEACQPGQASVLKVLAAAQTVAAGEKVTLTIGQSATGTETYYNVYRGRKAGSNAPNDMRLIGRVKKAGATTTFVDINDVIPGTSEIYLLTSNPSEGAMDWVQMLPMGQFPLAQTDLTMRWAVMLLGALRIPYAHKHAMVRNVLPSTALWKPF